jgi:hypothetical protein
MMSDTSNAESGSDVDDFGSSYIPKGTEYGCLTPVHEEVSSMLNSFLLLPSVSVVNFALFCFL